MAGVGRDMAEDPLRDGAARLRALLSDRPTPEGWETVRAGLASKWEGHRSLALQVLGRWGGREAAATLRAFVEASLSDGRRGAGHAIRSVAVWALAPRLTEGDAPWVLDLHFGRVPGRERHGILPLVLALPPGAARDRLVRELSSDDPADRLAAAVAIANIAVPDRAALLRPLLGDPDKGVRRCAAAFLARNAAREAARPPPVERPVRGETPGRMVRKRPR